MAVRKRVPKPAPRPGLRMPPQKGRPTPGPVVDPNGTVKMPPVQSPRGGANPPVFRGPSGGIYGGPQPNPAGPQAPPGVSFADQRVSPPNPAGPQAPPGISWAQGKPDIVNQDKPVDQFPPGGIRDNFVNVDRFPPRGGIGGFATPVGPSDGVAGSEGGGAGSGVPGNEMYSGPQGNPMGMPNQFNPNADGNQVDYRKLPPGFGLSNPFLSALMGGPQGSPQGGNPFAPGGSLYGNSPEGYGLTPKPLMPPAGGGPVQRGPLQAPPMAPPLMPPGPASPKPQPMGQWRGPNKLGLQGNQTPPTANVPDQNQPQTGNPDEFQTALNNRIRKRQPKGGAFGMGG